MAKKKLNPVDDVTMKQKGMVAPMNRPDKKPLHPNPIRRFREELHLTRQEFAALLDVSLDTEKLWEKTVRPVMPRSQSALKLIDLARRNSYPLLLEEIWDYVEKR